MLNVKRMLLGLALFLSSSAAWAQEAAKPDPAKPAVTLIDINSATVEQLMTLNGIGQKKAAAIVAEREAKGCFPNIEALDDVKGFGKKTIENLRPFIKADNCTANRVTIEPWTDDDIDLEAQAKKGKAKKPKK